jgi:hypothetical protein
MDEKNPIGPQHFFYAFVAIFVLWVIGGWGLIASLTFISLIAGIIYIVLRELKNDDRNQQ